VADFASACINLGLKIVLW